MIHQPTNPYPYLEAVDGTKDNTFRVLINARDVIDSYELHIRKLSDGSDVFSNRDVPPDVIYGSADGDSWLEIPIPADTLTNGTEYTWEIELFCPNMNSVISPEYYFKAVDTPVIEFAVPSTINSAILDVSVNYMQEQNVGISYYCFNLYSGSELINTTGNVLSRNIKYNYDGLISGNSYELELIILDDEKTRTVLSKYFTVEYDEYQTLALPKISTDRQKNCVHVDFSDNVVIEGKLEGSQSVDFVTFKNGVSSSPPSHTNAVSLSARQNLYWDSVTDEKSLNLDNTTQIIHWHGHEGFHGTILEKTSLDDPLSNVYVRYDGTDFYYKIGTNPEIKREIFTDEASAIYSRGNATSEPDETELVTIQNSIDEDICYIIPEDANIGEYDYILCNDIAYKYWWHIIILKDRVEIIKGKKFTETEVTE